MCRAILGSLAANFLEGSRTDRTWDRYRDRELPDEQRVRDAFREFAEQQRRTWSDKQAQDTRFGYDRDVAIGALQLAMLDDIRERFEATYARRFER